jgi:uncharacterized membrane protein
MKSRARFVSVLSAATLLAAVPASAQDTDRSSAEPVGLWLMTPYPELALEPGETSSISITVRNAQLPPQRAALEVTGVPEGWDWTLKGGGREITAVMVGPDQSERITLELTPPADASQEEFPIELRARNGERTIALPLVVRLSEAEQGGLTVEPELPALRGTARSTFTFRVRVTNDGPEEALFNLAASVPEGFQTRFKRGYGSEEITGVPIDAGASETVTLEVVPSRAVAAGRYPIVMEVSDGGTSATAELSVEVTGEPAVRIVGPQERLSGEAVAGEETSFPFTLVNAGSAPAMDLELAATPPSGWTVEFEPERIDALAPNSTREVNVKITPSERAVAGDYMVAVRASGGPVSESVQFRTTVRTSTLWGAAGLGVIAVAVLVLGGAVMRYGRR